MVNEQASGQTKEIEKDRKIESPNSKIELRRNEENNIQRQHTFTTNYGCENLFRLMVSALSEQQGVRE